MPDLFNYMLTGVKASEYTNCTTTQLLDAAKGTWSQRVTEALGIPSRLFTSIVQPGTVIGRLNPETCDELGVDPIKVVSVASHDTAKGKPGAVLKRRILSSTAAAPGQFSALW